MKLQIPTSQHAAAKDFLSLSDGSMKDLLETLKKAPPALNVSSLADYVNKKTKIGADKSKRIIEMLASLYINRDTSVTIPEFVKAFRLAAEEEGFAPASKNWESIEQHLSQILSLDTPLEVTSKAFDLMTEHNSVFLNARVLTDLRPVFASDPSDPPLAMALCHILKIHYHEGSLHKEFFVALDGNDVQQMQDVFQRAARKEAGLKKWAKKLKMPLICVES